jgi:hypothetical protein
MRPLFLWLPALLLVSCQPRLVKTVSTEPVVIVEEAPPPAAPKSDVRQSVVRVSSTLQDWNPWQPWEKNAPRKRRGLAAIVAPERVLTTAELAADATFIEFESVDGTRFTPAEIVAIDYEANLVLLGPAGESEGKSFFQGTVPLAIASPPGMGAALEILQVEESGVALRTQGALQSVDLASGFLPGQNFLTYMVKASMQSAASSYSLPVLSDGALAGVLISYNSKDQICDVSATEIVARFLTEASNGGYKGFPSLGVAISGTEDPSFRQWLGLNDQQGGIYIRTVRKGGAAETAGVRKGDVLLAVDGQPIDRRGYYQDSAYGSLSWGHLIRGTRATGDSVALALLREGKPLEVKVTLTRDDDSKRLVPAHLFGVAPNFLVKGGLVFQELNRPLLESFGEDWQSRAPLELLDAYENPEKYENRVNRIVFLGGVIPTPATVGYESIRNLVVHKVNGREIRDMKELIAAFDTVTGDLHSIEFTDEKLTVHLDDTVATAVDSQLLQRGIRKLSRADGKP